MNLYSGCHKNCPCEIALAYTFDESGRIIYLDLNEYAITLNEQYAQEINDADLFSPNYSEEISYSSNYMSIQPLSLVSSYSYTPGINTIVSGSAIKVTPDVTGPATISYGQSIGVTASYGEK